MTETIILSVASVVLLYLALARKDQKSVLLTAGLALSLVIVWFNQPWAYLVSNWLYLIMALLIGLSVLREKEATKWERILVMALGFWAALSKLFQINAWPYEAEITSSMAIPIVLFLFAFKPKYQSKYQMEFLNLLWLAMWLEVIL